MKRGYVLFVSCVLLLLGVAVVDPAGTGVTVVQAQAAPQAPSGRGGRGGPAIVSPEIGADGRVTFRLYAPQAGTVTVSGDISLSLVPADDATGGGSTPAVVMTKGADGVWTGTTIRPVRPGAWRYTFTVDGVATVDPRNTNLTHSQTAPSSMLYVPGDFSETRNVPHGTIGRVRYVSKVLGNVPREMYVYTPPGYERGDGRFPVLYLIHGGGDTALSWTTVGRAPDILDNLIAEGRAVPMIVVMPSGWTPSGGQVMTSDASKDPFTRELLEDIIPFVESNYRTPATPDARALGGLSMGGIQTLNIGLTHLGTFRYLVVMSSGWVSEDDRQWFYRSQADRIPTYNDALKLFWWGWGETDIARENGLAVIETFRRQGVRIETLETPGGHTWDNWRLYLHEVAPKLFR